MSVQARTELALLSAKRGDGDEALSQLEAARGRAGTTNTQSIVAKRADDVGTQLHEIGQWQQAIAAYEIAATIHDLNDRYWDFVRSTELAKLARQRWVAESR